MQVLYFENLDVKTEGNLFEFLKKSVEKTCDHDKDDRHKKKKRVSDYKNSGFPFLYSGAR